jgi:hypothetical protein
MLCESLGACGTAARYDGRAKAELELGIAFLLSYVGAPPTGCTLEIVEHEHELGVYATIGLCCGTGSFGDEEWRYFSRCETALVRFDGAVDWPALGEVLWMDAVDDDEETDEGDEGGSDSTAD